MIFKLLFLLAYYPVFGVPVLIWLSAVTFLLIGFGLSVALFNRKGIYFVPLKFHMIFGIVGIILLFIQTILILTVFGY